MSEEVLFIVKNNYEITHHTGLSPALGDIRDKEYILD
jgi:hypothetical protein